MGRGACLEWLSTLGKSSASLGMKGGGETPGDQCVSWCPVSHTGAAQSGVGSHR